MRSYQLQGDLQLRSDAERPEHPSAHCQHLQFVLSHVHRPEMRGRDWYHIHFVLPVGQKLDARDVLLWSERSRAGDFGGCARWAADCDFGVKNSELTVGAVSDVCSHTSLRHLVVL